MFLLTASAHWGKRRPDLIRMVPAAFPRPDLIITITGLLELLGAVGLLLPATAGAAAACLAALLVAMFPANVRAAQHHLTISGKAATGLPLRTFLQVVFIAALLAAGFPDAMAVWWAPGKTPSVSRSEQAKTADALHGGRYEELPNVLEALTAAYVEDPRDAQTAAHIGFSHVWRFTERARLDTQSATITDELVLARRWHCQVEPDGRQSRNGTKLQRSSLPCRDHWSRGVALPVVRKNSIQSDSTWHFRLERFTLLGWTCCSFSFTPSIS